MKKVTRVCLMLSLAGIAMSSCKKDKDDPITPANPNESEQITTMKLMFTDTLTLEESTFTFRDADGDGGANPSVFDTIRLEPSKAYDLEILLLDESKTPVDTISYEVEEEGAEHQFFFTAIGADVTITADDMDENDVPIGLESMWSTGAATTDKNGKVTIILKHQGDKKPKTGDGDATIGDTDIEVLFPIIIK